MAKGQMRSNREKKKPKHDKNKKKGAETTVTLLLSEFVVAATDKQLSEHHRLGRCFGSLADISGSQRHVSFTPESGHSPTRAACPLVPLADIKTA
jgi:hypothetical protein